LVSRFSVDAPRETSRRRYQRGSIDVPGGNVHFAQVPVNDVSGSELRDAEQWQKALGLAERPLGLPPFSRRA